MTGTYVGDMLFTGDNLDVLTGLNSESVDLIYLDPPFNSKRTYSAPVGSKAAGASFKDMWTWSDVDETRLEYLFDKHPDIANYIQSIEALHGKPMMAYITYMALRLVELHRILKSTGSLYLHVDPTASHYLKLVLDTIFGSNNYRNEIIWKRTKGSKTSSTKYGASTDTMLFYVKSKLADKDFKPQFNSNRPGYTEYINTKFNHEDPDGRKWQSVSLQSPSMSPSLIYNYKGYNPPAKGWSVNLAAMQKLDAEGRLHYPKTQDGRLRRKSYADELKGYPVDNLWDDIQALQGGSKEATGYPTQKPLKLLERIIKASSNEGDVVLDPFCGCATTCVAAQSLGRKWIGIDIEEQASNLVIDRITNDGMSLRNYMHSTVTPIRSDIETIEPSRPEVRKILFKEQEGTCKACKNTLEIQYFEVDHIIPKSKGGPNCIQNYQLLCGPCNKSKGDRPMEYLMSKIRKRNAEKLKYSFGA